MPKFAAVERTRTEEYTKWEFSAHNNSSILVEEDEDGDWVVYKTYRDDKHSLFDSASRGTAEEVARGTVKRYQANPKKRSSDYFWEERTKRYGHRDNVPWEVLEFDYGEVRYKDDENLDPQGVEVTYQVAVKEEGEEVELLGHTF